MLGSEFRAFEGRLRNFLVEVRGDECCERKVRRRGEGTRLIENSRAAMQVSMSHIQDQRAVAPIHPNHIDLDLFSQCFQLSLIFTCGCDMALASGKSETCQARQLLVGLRKSVLRPLLPELWHFTPHAHLTLRRFRVLDRAMLLQRQGQAIEIHKLINTNIEVMSNGMLLCACVA